VTAARTASFALAALVTSLSASQAGATPNAPSEAQEDRQTFGGLGSALNFRGVADESDGDITFSSSRNRALVEAMRLSGRMLLLPAVDQATTWWGAWVGVRAAGFHFEQPAGSGDSAPGGFNPANIQPTLGVVVEAVADEVRFEADVAPVISMALDSPVASQAALVAAFSTAPHDDLLFVPNVRGGARVRLALSRRLRLCPSFALAWGAEVESGYAKIATPLGTGEGGTGGAAIHLGLQYRTPRTWPIEGLYFEVLADAGWTAVWPAQVVIPTLLGGGPRVAFNRTLEARLLVSWFGADPIEGRIDSFATTLGLRWSFGAEPIGWTQRQIDLEPELERR
jgi:hypothetical protein